MRSRCCAVDKDQIITLAAPELNWCFLILVEPAHKLERGGFELPTNCERAHAEFLCHANPLMGFIDDRCIFDPDARTPLAEFREALRVWARDQGIRGVPADKRLKRKLEGLGLEVNKVKGYHKVYGLRLKS